MPQWPKGMPAKTTLIKRGIDPYARKVKIHKKPKVTGHAVKKDFPAPVPEEERELIRNDYLELSKKFAVKEIVTQLRLKYNRDARIIVGIIGDANETFSVRLLDKQIERYKSGKGIDWDKYIPRALELVHMGLYESVELTKTEKEFAKMILVITKAKRAKPVKKSEGENPSDIFGTD